MKIALLLCLILSVPSKVVAEIESHTFSFNESDFSIKVSTGDSLSITSISIPAAYPSITGPGLPIIGKSIVLTNGGSIENYSATVSKRLIRTGYNILNARNPEPTGVSSFKLPQYSEGYAAKIYPDSVCTLSQCYEFGGINVASFQISPFIFDAEKQNLYFVDSVCVNMEITPILNPQIRPKIRQDQIEILRSVVDNPEKITSHEPVRVDRATDAIVVDTMPKGHFEYVIITSNSLKQYFQPLADWKHKKGVPAKITTIPEIDQMYSDETQQMRIKHYLEDCYNNHGTLYVLLGGDDYVVPAQMCYVAITTGPNGMAEYLPTDLYYSCVSGRMNWDTNNNGKAGEMWFDNVDYIPDLYLTRAPVRAAHHIKAFVDRTIQYEQTPKYSKSFLQTGASFDWNYPSDILADRLFMSVIENKIIMGANKFFDNYTYSGVEFTPQSFLSELRSKYTNVEIFCHGNETSWLNWDGTPFFNVSAASKLDNPWHTLITTMSCSTNAFDGYVSGAPDPCLSESLIRNPQSGVIGYLGSSREGWFNHSNSDDALMYSMAYEKDFYYRLLDPTSKPENKNFGLLVNTIKHSMLSLMNERIYRWLHYSINAMGDPEMPLFNTYPQSFDSVAAEYNDEGMLVVYTGSNEARVCVSGIGDNEYYAVGRGSKLAFKTGQGAFDVWITQQNYIPKHIEIEAPIKVSDLINKTNVSSKITSVSPNPATTQTSIQFMRGNPDSKLELSLTDISTAKRYVFNISENERDVSVDISNLKNGIYVVNLIENGILIPGHDRLLKE